MEVKQIGWSQRGKQKEVRRRREEKEEVEDMELRWKENEIGGWGQAENGNKNDEKENRSQKEQKEGFLAASLLYPLFPFRCYWSSFNYMALTVWRIPSLFSLTGCQISLLCHALWCVILAPKAASGIFVRHNGLSAISSVNPSVAIVDAESNWCSIKQ